MTPRLAVLPLISASWAGAGRALKPGALWLILFALTAGLYSVALRSEAGLWLPLGAAVAAFLAGNELSRRVYAALIPGARAKLLPLTHANLAVYFLFAMLLIFVAPFLNLLSGILIQAKGVFELGADSTPEEIGQATLDLLPSAYGAVFVAACVAGFGALGWIALRLALYGAATAATGEARVFRTWRLTRGQIRALLPASLATHVLPFAAAIGLNMALHAAMPQTGAGHFVSGAVGVLLFAPFLLAGHGMAASAWQYLKPAEGKPPVSGD